MTPWTIAHQTLLSTEFSRLEYWNGLPFPPPGDVPDPGMEPTSPVSPALAARFFYHCATREAEHSSITHQLTAGSGLLCSVAPVVSDSFRPHGLQPARLLCPWDSPGQNTGVGCHDLLQGTFQPRDRTCFSCFFFIAGRSLPLSYWETAHVTVCIQGPVKEISLYF